MADRPNVLWICTDQQFAGAMRCAGTGHLDTPAMDSIADAGTRFSNAYCANPLCTPSRASMLTGRMPSQVGVEGNDSGIDEQFRDQELGNLFADAGYDCAYAGKWHVTSARHVEDGHGFDELCGMDDHRVPEVCAEYLEANRAEPFFLAAHFDNPHNICEWSRDYTAPWGKIDDPPARECPPLPTNHAVPPYEPKIIRDTIEDHWAMGAMEGATAEEWRQYRNAYYRMIESADRGVGRILDALREQGLDEDTLVVFTSDHGDMHGAHQMVQKTFLYEESVRIPLLVSPPGAGEGDGGDVSERLVSNGLDLLPTLCDYAGIDAPEDLRGRSLRPLVEADGSGDAGGEAGDDGVDDWRDYVVTETINGDAHIDGRSIRTERYKYVVYHEQRHNEQLFDLEADPGEMVDLAESADHADVLERHRDLLLEWCEETGDTFGARYHHPGVPMIPGYDFEDLWPRFFDEPPGMR